LAAGDEWIMDGNYSNTLQVRLARADTAIFLDYPRIVCLLGVLKRWLANVGRTRADMAPGCPEKLDWEFIQWVWNFNKRSRRQTLGALAGFNGRVYVFKSRRQTACFLKELSRRD
ncbi:hypothetical protein LJB77_01130, partial [Ruminococcaceae bacterium OttesenSCG-928-N02]|nr:hypothetical protein [Ruminococcaceae bacterium OttesenSCG-928-N02]